MIKLKPNWYLKMVLDPHVPASMVSTCWIGNTLDQCVSAKYLSLCPFWQIKQAYLFAIYEKGEQNDSSLRLRPKVLS